MINNRQNGRRRGRGGGQRPPNPGNAGNRQDNRQRGNAAQLHEKYKALARDTQLAGDRVQTEYYLQFADHYFRVLNEGRARFEEQRRPRDDYGADEDEDQDEGINAQDQDDRDDRDDRSDERPQRQDYRNGSDRNDRGDRPERVERAERPERTERADRGDRNEPRRERTRYQPREVHADDEGEEERISLDVLPPAIAANTNSDADIEAEEAPRAPRRRAPRRPRPDSDEEIAPAA